MSSNIVVRKCHTIEEFREGVELQRVVWGENYGEIKPVISFIVASHTGGQVLGAFDGDKMVGITLAVAAFRENNKPYLHSHMTGILPEYRDHGIGRKLKLFQREEALGRGLQLIQWTFDPLESLNAHFNLNRLGAIVRHYLPNIYGVTSSPLHRGLPTDRFLAEWYLDSPRVIAAIEGLLKLPEDAPATVELPAELEAWKKEDPAKVAEVQTRIRGEFQNWFARGYAVIGLRRTEKGISYILAPWSEF